MHTIYTRKTGDREVQVNDGRIEYYAPLASSNLPALAIIGASSILILASRQRHASSLYSFRRMKVKSSNNAGWELQRNTRKSREKSPSIDPQTKYSKLTDRQEGQETKR